MGLIPRGAVTSADNTQNLRRPARSTLAHQQWSSLETVANRDHLLGLRICGLLLPGPRIPTGLTPLPPAGGAKHRLAPHGNHRRALSLLTTGTSVTLGIRGTDAGPGIIAAPLCRSVRQPSLTETYGATSLRSARSTARANSIREVAPSLWKRSAYAFPRSYG